MNRQLREHADQIVREAIAAVQPDAAVQRALSGMDFVFAAAGFFASIGVSVDGPITVGAQSKSIRRFSFIYIQLRR